MTTRKAFSAKKPRQAPDPVPVLVLGDWIVDENWVLARHQSRHSSIKGHKHLRALGGLDSTSMDLCGAGRVAKFLYWHNRFEPCESQEDGRIVRWKDPAERQSIWFDIVGVGTWGRRDTPELRRMFHPAYPAGVNAFTLKPNSRRPLPICEREGLLLWNLAEACAGAEVGTTRLFRLYQNRAELERGLDLEQRIDFELRSESRSYADEALGKLLEKLGDKLKADKVLKTPPFRFAIIMDFGKGTVAKSVLARLEQAELINKETLWLITSKQPRPGWLENWDRDWGRVLCWFLHPRAVAQLELGEQSAHMARDHLPELPTEWFIAGSRPAREAILGLQELSQRQFKHSEQGGILVAMPKGLSLLAVMERGEKRCGFYQPEPLISETEEELVGRAGIFFSALAKKLIQQEYQQDSNVAEDPADRLGDYLWKAVAEARRNVEAGIGLLARMGEEKEKPEISVPVGLGIYPVSQDELRRQAASRVHRFDWREEIADWKAALTGTGVILRDQGYQLDVWRAMCELDGYIELVDGKRREIARLIHLLRQCDPRESRGSISALLIASPGSGKSYLVSLLANKLNMKRLGFNVTQMVTRENLVACFDAIASSQAHDRDLPHLVFFDEINALVENSHVYDLFLTVLEDGTYLRRGQRFKLDPCVWLFAGTERLRTGAQAREEMADSGTLEQYLTSKAPDFRSRLTLKEVELDRRGADEEVRLGFVYHGAVQLQRLHPDVRRISAEVLSAFYCMPLDTTIRDLIHVAERFQDIQFGEVRRRNMPEDLPRGVPGIWQEEFGGDGEGHARHWDHDLDHQMVEIRRYPGSSDRCLRPKAA